MRLCRLCGVILLILFTGINLLAQENTQKRFFTSQSGLKISWVHNITSGPGKSILMSHGAVFHLTAWDGYSFHFIPSPHVVLGKVSEDFSGHLWSVIPGKTDEIRLFSQGEWQVIDTRAGYPFLPSPGDGNKLLFLRDGFLEEYNNVTRQTRIIRIAGQAQIGRFNDMIASMDGSVWITGEYGAASYWGSADTIRTPEQWFEFPVSEELGIHGFTKPFEGKNGELITLSRSSRMKKNVLVGFNGESWKILYTSKSEDIFAGWRGHDSTLWIVKGTPSAENGPLRDWELFNVENGNETRVEKNRVLNAVLNDIITYPDGTFMLATGSGLARFTPSLWRSPVTNVNINRRFKLVHQDQEGRIWFAGEDSFYLFNKGIWKAYRFMPAVFTGDVSSLNNGLKVVGIYDGGLALFNPEKESYEVSYPFGNEKVRYYDQSPDGNTFVVLQSEDGTSRLVKYNGVDFQTVADRLDINSLAPGECEITQILQTQNGDIWITTFTQVIVYKEGIRTSFNLKEEFEWDISTSVLELDSGKVWIGGSKGILQYEENSWTHIHAPEFETVRGMMLASDGAIWVGSGTGVHRFINGTWVTNTYEDGLPNSVVFDVLEDRRGKIWASTYNGLSLYYPETDPSPPETFIPSGINLSEALPSGEMQFVFEGVDKWGYTLKERLLYSCRFDDDQWMPFEKRTVAMAKGLSAGPHHFEVRAMDRNGRIDPTPAVWPFVVLRPWYKEPLLIVVLAIGINLIILSLAFAITRHYRIEKLVIVRTNELSLTNKRLENEIAVRKITESELIKAKEKAEESDRLKTAFLANMSHEIRTPMNGILGFTELLKEPNLTSDEQRDFIQTIQISGARMLYTINNIIDVSKIESGLMNIDIVETDINEKIAFTYKFFREEVKAKGLQFIVKPGLPSEKAIIRTDNEKVYAILTNLIKNAIKFTYDGSIEFGYVLRSGSEVVGRSRNAGLEFFVKDTGVGIAANRRELIFERFRQGSESLNRNYEGSGLGLSICKSYVEMLGGKIWVESVDGSGSVFYFTIPYNPVSAEKSINETVISEKDIVFQEKKLKILIVEDDETSYSLLSRMLLKISYRVLHAVTGVEAVDACLMNPDLDLVMMDIRMPLMDGNEATRLIRQFNKDVIIIAQTAYAFPDDREKAIKAGCNDYISKPINAALLYELIRKHVKK